MTNKIIFYPDELISQIEKNGNRITFKKGEFIYHPGDPTAYIYIIQKGQVFIENACRGCRTRNQPAKGKKDIRSSDAVLRA